MTTWSHDHGHLNARELAPSPSLGPRLRFGKRSISAFHLFGTLGFVLSLATWFGAAALRGLSLGVMAALVGSSIVTFLGLAMLTKIVLGAEELVYYRHEILVLFVAASGLWATGQPVLPYLEITLLGVGVFLACGRIGCFFVGCCHGVPHSFGIRYGKEHAAAGFPEELVGVRLLPVQLAEALTVASVVAVGVAMIGRGAPAGTVLAWYSVVYGTARFALEFVRGDGTRLYYGSFSEAQWTTLALMGLVGAAEIFGVLPLTIWHVAVTAALAVFMLVWALTDGSSRRLFRAAHVRELAVLLRAADSQSRETGRLQVGETRAGLRLSACTVLGPRASSVHTLAFSVANQALSATTARKLGKLLSRLEGKSGELVSGRSGVHHLVFPDSGGDHGV